MDGTVGLVRALDAVAFPLLIVITVGLALYFVGAGEIAVYRARRQSWAQRERTDYGTPWQLTRWLLRRKAERVSRQWRADRAVAETKVGVEGIVWKWPVKR